MRWQVWMRSLQRVLQRFRIRRRLILMATKSLHTPQPATPARKRALSKSGQARARMRNLEPLVGAKIKVEETYGTAGVKPLLKPKIDFTKERP